MQRSISRIKEVKRIKMVKIMYLRGKKVKNGKK